MHLLCLHRFTVLHRLLRRKIWLWLPKAHPNGPLLVRWTKSPCFKQPTAAPTISCRNNTRRAKGRNAVDYYEEGMSPLLAYMFFVLHYHENFLTINGIHEWPIIPHSAIRRFTDRVAWIRQFSVPMPRILKEDVEHSGQPTSLFCR